MTRLFELRHTSGNQLAQQIGLSPTAVNRLKNGETDDPGVSKLLAIARALDVPLEWLADDTQEWPPPSLERSSASVLEDVCGPQAWQFLQDLGDTTATLAMIGAAYRFVFDMMNAKVDIPELSERETLVLARFIGQQMQARAVRAVRVAHDSGPLPMPAMDKPSGVRPLKKAARRREQDQSREGKQCD